MINFKQPYNRTDFLNFLWDDLLPEDFVKCEDDISFEAEYTRKVTFLGNSESLELAVFEVLHNSKHDARVSLSKEAFRLLLRNSTKNKALILFVPLDNPNTYRFSLVTIDVEIDENKVRKSYSNPRRYSFKLGTDAMVETPKRYLAGEKGRIKDEKDLKGRFSVEALTKEFYRELSDWYFWAIDHVHFPSEPEDGDMDKLAEHKSKNVIRLLTRLLFVWFLKQKRLIPDEFFNEEYIEKNLLKGFNPNQKQGLGFYKTLDSKYYKAILQNLFFAMLNCPITPQSKEDTRERGFRKKDNWGQHRDANFLMRYEELFKDPKLFLSLANSTIPFLNGGLFDCLDDKSAQPPIYIDGFSDNLVKPHKLIVPDFLFFGEKEGKGVDLSGQYGDKKKKSVNIKGLIDILSTYNFTIVENTPIDQEVSLDPELLGKVFENLLASYNPETKSTARKQTGSFYTPREIVQYMVDESLIAYLKNEVGEELEPEYRKLMKYTDDEICLSQSQKAEIIKALFRCKIIDPACGSGAFPVGILQQMVHILRNIDQDNRNWESLILDEAAKDSQDALQDKNDNKEDLLAEIGRAFDQNINRPDYARKLYLIENCIYGVDIQAIAVQISKLRFFISLVVEQKANSNPEDNFGIRPLPNLDAKFVAANTLIGIEKKEATLFDSQEIKAKEKELKLIRHKIFSAKNPAIKRNLKESDKVVRNELAELLSKNKLMDDVNARILANWDPYDQNASSPFFDPEWMFGIIDGFDIVIGNPPYIKEYTDRSVFDGIRNSPYYQGKMDIWYMFACSGIDMLSESGHLCFIATNNWITNGGASKLRYKIINDTKVIQLVDFGNFMIFESASIQTMVMMFSKNTNFDNYSFDYRKLRGDTKLVDVLDLLVKKENNKTEYLMPVITRKQLKNSLLTFSANEIILSKIATNSNALNLTEKEVAQGIVFPQDFLNKKNQALLGSSFVVGESIFALTENKKRYLDLSAKESELIKPYYTTEQIHRYYSEPNNTLWLIYTDSKFKNPISMNNFPNIKNHLDRFAGVITSDNKPYGLHRSREERFFNGEKIIVQRKCVGRPSFSYADFETYVSATFYVIKTERVNQKYLLGLLNSKLMEFWLKNKGKMQGDNFQLDKEPLVNIPILLPNNEALKSTIVLVDKILDAKRDNIKADTSTIESQIDQLVYLIYGLMEDEISIIENR